MRGTFHRLGDGLIGGLALPGAWGGLWSRVKVRKNTTCLLSGAAIEKGDASYAPVGCNTAKRSQRIRADLIDDVENAPSN